MTALTITPAQRKSLKTQAHDLSPVVMIGGDGLTPAVIKEAKLAIAHHGLIKIRVFGDEREARIAMYEELCDKLDAAPVQHIGKLLVIWKPKAEIDTALLNLDRSYKQTKNPYKHLAPNDRVFAPHPKRVFGLALPKGLIDVLPLANHPLQELQQSRRQALQLQPPRSECYVQMLLNLKSAGHHLATVKQRLQQRRLKSAKHA